MTNPNIVTVGQVAKELGIGVAAVRKLVADGYLERLPGYDKPWLIRRCTVEAWLHGPQPVPERPELRIMTEDGSEQRRRFG